MTTTLLVIPFQAQAQPTLSEDTYFPIESDAVILICTEGPESVGQESNSTF